MNNFNKETTMNNNDSFLKLFRMQHDLMKIVESHSGSTGDAKGSAIALMVETSELLNEEGSFKWWKKNHTQDKEKILEEYVDILFFWLQLGIKLGFGPLSVFEAYKKKWEKNVKRQEDGY